MSLLTDAFKTLREVILLDDRVKRLEKDMGDLASDVDSHELRLRQLETLFFGPVPPDQLRIPRR
jgi:hypothetical protein